MPKEELGVNYDVKQEMTTLCFSQCDDGRGQAGCKKAAGQKNLNLDK